MKNQFSNPIKSANPMRSSKPKKLERAPGGIRLNAGSDNGLIAEFKNKKQKAPARDVAAKKNAIAKASLSKGLLKHDSPTRKNRQALKKTSEIQQDAKEKPLKIDQNRMEKTRKEQPIKSAPETNLNKIKVKKNPQHPHFYQEMLGLGITSRRTMAGNSRGKGMRF